MTLFRLRAGRIGKDELCSVDSTSISTYGFNISDIRWGKNKDQLVSSLNYMTLTFDDDNTLIGAVINHDKLDRHLMTAGFFANKTLRLDLDPLQAMNSYGMRDEQEI